MSDLVCDHCEPREPVRGDPYYAIDRIVVSEKDGVVDAESGHVRRSDHTYDTTTIYAECTDCGTVLLDRCEDVVGDLQ